jgi:HAMP domain-containing protein
MFVAEEELGGKRFVRGIVPVKDASGRRVGGLVVVHDVTALREQTRAALRRQLGLVVAAAVVLALLLVGVVDRAVLRRVDGLRRSMDGLTGRLAAGDKELEAPAAAAPDEVGKAEDALRQFVRAIRGYSGR